MGENVNAARGLASPPASVRAIVSWLEAAASGTATKAGVSSSLAVTVGHRPKIGAGSPAVPSPAGPSSSPTVPPPPSTASLRRLCPPMQQQQKQQQQKQKQLPLQKQNADDNDPFISKRPVCRQHSSSSTTTTSTSSTATATTATTNTASSSSTPSNGTSEAASLTLLENKTNIAQPPPARCLDGAVTGHSKMGTNWPHYHHLDNHHHKTGSLQRLDEVMRDLAWFSEPDAHHEYDHSCEKQEGLLGGVAQRRPRQEVDAFWYSVRRYLDVTDEELYA